MLSTGSGSANQSSSVCRICCLLLLTVAPSTIDARVCAADHAGNPLIGEHSAVGRDAPTLLRIQQNDLDVEVLVRRGALSVLHNGPGGRNGVEWVYLAPSQAAPIELCIYAVYRQAVAGSYEISRSELSGADEGSVTHCKG